MRAAVLAAVLPAVLSFTSSRAADVAGDARRFDGTWTTIVDCAKASDGALGYTLQFDSKVNDGVLIGEHDQNLSPYAYHVKAQFDDKRGTGSRVELRKCGLTFIRQ